MINRYRFDKTQLNIGQHKTIDCCVDLEIATLEDDEYAEQKDDPSEYVDGVRVMGELRFDTSPIHWKDKHPVRKGVTGTMILRGADSGEDTTKITVLLVEPTNTVDLVKDGRERKICRYFWMFYGIGKPFWDKLELFPTDYEGKPKPDFKVFTCTDFRGYWPVGVSSLVVAPNKRKAKEMLDAELRRRGIRDDDVFYNLNEVNMHHPGVLILQDGD